MSHTKKNGKMPPIQKHCRHFFYWVKRELQIFRFSMVKPHPNLWGVQILGRHKSCFASLRHLHFQKITSCHRIKLLFLIRSFIRTQKKTNTPHLFTIETRQLSQTCVPSQSPSFFTFKPVYPRLLQVLLWALPIWSNQVQALLQRSTCTLESKRFFQVLL